jgi:hypothetical protein
VNHQTFKSQSVRTNEIASHKLPNMVRLHNETRSNWSPLLINIRGTDEVDDDRRSRGKLTGCF